MYRKGNRTRRGNRSQRFLNYTKGAANVASTAATALKIATTVAGLINVEFKRHDTALGAGVSNSGTVLPLTQIGGGSTEITREGDQCKLMSLQMRMMSVPHASGDDTLLRVIIFKDTKNTGTNPVVTDVLQSTTMADFKAFDNKNRFVFLYDKVFGFGGTIDSPRFVKYFKKIPLHLHYTSTAAADTIGCHLYALFISNESTNTPTVTCKFRCRYIDN